MDGGEPCRVLNSSLGCQLKRKYEVEYKSKKYQVEVTILENSATYMHVAVAVDDGHFWRAIRPLASSFICKKHPKSS